jgi:signal transduction histidine kinase
MKILGEELGNVGRWYIALPPLLLIGFLVGLFFVAAAGQSRLNAADQRLHNSETREHALNEFVVRLTEAESAQRAYLLTGDDGYLKAYTGAAAKVVPALNGLLDAYRPRSLFTEELRGLRVLTGKKLAEWEDALALYRQRDTASATGLVGTGVGEKTAADISNTVDLLHQKEDREFTAATTQWESDLSLSRWITMSGAILNIGLVILASALVYGDMRRRARQAIDLRDQKQELEQQVAERTHELTALSTHLQGVSEQEKSALSRELHDELGGLLVAARMDLSWLQQRLPTSDPNIEQRFKRIHESLSAGVDLKRRVVEELRPTLLDNMGLFTALRWQFKESCRRTGLKCTESIPELELKFSPDAAIGVFRVAQESLMNIIKHAGATSADLTVDIRDDTFVLRISDDGRGMPANLSISKTSHGIASMRHRIAALGGTWEVRASAAGGTVVTAQIPLHAMLPHNSQSAAVVASA